MPFATERLKIAASNSDIIICDEIGPMELKSGEFRVRREPLDVDKKVVIVVHHKTETYCD